MKEEIFGPLLSVYVYDPADIGDVMKKALYGTRYGLTASIFSKDPEWIIKASEIFKHASGNFYINDKSTGAIVGQQPFGGSRNSGNQIHFTLLQISWKMVLHSQS